MEVFLTRKKVPGAFFNCQQVGHYANRCPEKRHSSVKRVEVADGYEESADLQTECQFHSLSVVPSEVEVKATQVRTSFATSAPIVTCVKLHDACVAKFECDTAASHNVISV